MKVFDINAASASLSKLPVERAKLILSKVKDNVLNNDKCTTWHCAGHNKHSGDHIER